MKEFLNSCLLLIYTKFSLAKPVTICYNNRNDDFKASLVLPT